MAPSRLPLGFLVASLVVVIGTLPASSASRAFLIFGDSLVDSGNNNFLLTSARADSYPYGIDFPTRRATGRFSNGLNLPDIISEHLGAEYTLPYLSPELTGEKLLVGANFASAGIGILNDTGVQFANIIRIQQQMDFFRQYKQRLATLIGPEAAKSRVNGALVLITLGGNDFVNNYYLVPFSARSRQYALTDYIPFLISEYRKILLELYSLGARQVLVQAVGTIGCVPAELALRSPNGDCDPELMRVPKLYNPQLVQMVTGLNSQLGSPVFTVADAFEMSMDILANPRQYGFVTSKIACCGQGPYNGIGLCTAMSSVCPNRNAYVFWDPFHPTERANRIIASTFMTGSMKYMNPMNLSTILAMDKRV